jgi:hypothetical protein
MRKRFLLLLPLLIFASPTAERYCPPPQICEPWLSFPDETVSLCVDEDALTMISSDVR